MTANQNLSPLLHHIMHFVLGEISPIRLWIWTKRLTKACEENTKIIYVKAIKCYLFVLFIDLFINSSINKAGEILKVLICARNLEKSRFTKIKSLLKEWPLYMGGSVDFTTCNIYLYLCYIDKNIRHLLETVTEWHTYIHVYIFDLFIFLYVIIVQLNVYMLYIIYIFNGTHNWRNN